MSPPFDKQDAREIVRKCNSQSEAIDYDYWTARAADVLTGALGRIDELEKENLELRVAIIGPDQIQANQAAIIDDQNKRIAELAAAPLRLTAEQRAALETVLDLADGYECKYAECAIDQKNTLSIVRSMLIQSQPAWQITEERKIAMKQVLTLLTGGQPKDLHWDMRAIVIFKDLLAETEARP